MHSVPRFQQARYPTLASANPRRASASPCASARPRPALVSPPPPPGTASASPCSALADPCNASASPCRGPTDPRRWVWVATTAGRCSRGACRAGGQACTAPHDASPHPGGALPERGSLPPPPLAVAHAALSTQPGWHLRARRRGAQEHPVRVGRCPQPPLLAAAPAAAPARLAVAQRRRVDLWQLGAALSRSEQVRSPGVPGFQ